ncbi:MAG TPA: carbamoyltransferase C-terminal domain-containing protein [Streptosporangiaceae bacterium]|nr:carbamoyltransferase C-terminal domain-containing protein [Streptosporangiaceae bacterium]
MTRPRSPRTVLGICSFTHDSAAALIADGTLIGMAEEERLSDVKHTREYPAAAVRWLLGEAGLTVAAIDTVAYNFAGHRYLAGLAGTPGHLLNPATRSRAFPHAASFMVIHHRFRQRMARLESLFPNANVRCVPHHMAHGMYAFAASGFSDAAVLIIDSLGETCTTSIGIGHAQQDGQARYRILESISDPASLGYVYGAVTTHLGWRRGDEEGTVMALAATGDPARFRDLLARAIPLTSAGFALSPDLFPLRVLRHGWPRVTAAFTSATCPSRDPGDDVTQVHADLAAALQERTEQVMVHLARRTRTVTGARRLSVGGGVAMNCVGIGKIIEDGQWEQVYVPPAPGDSGTAIGAALVADAVASCELVRSCYLGPSYPDFIPAAVPAPGLSARRVDDPARFLAVQLAAGKIAGLFQGRLEAGPRALGNRSILASPIFADVTGRLNAAVKFREPFRPFAPVILAEHAADYFCIDQPSPFMSIAVPVTALAKSKVPAVVHANWTARVQILERDHNPFLADVLDHFAAMTGIPVLINTSLNVKGKPISGTPEMAIDCLATSGLDGLMLDGGWWVSK